MSVAVITDSSSDISREQAMKMGVDVVPLCVIVGEARLRDGIDIDHRSFYRKLGNGELPKTEPPTAEQFAAVFAKQIEAGRDVFASLISSSISKTYANACEAAKRFGSKVLVVDSKASSGLLMLLIAYAAELAQRGADLAELAERVDRNRLRGQAYFTMPDVSFLGRTGRLPKAVVTLGSLLNVSLVLRMTDAGDIGPAGQSRSFEKSQELMIDQALRALGENGTIRMAVAHANAPAVAETLQQRLRAKLRAGSHVSLYEVGPTIASHLGSGSVGIAAIVT